MSNYEIKNGVLEFDGFKVYAISYIGPEWGIASYKLLAHMAKLLEDYDTVKKERDIFRAQFYRDHPNGM